MYLCTERRSYIQNLIGSYIHILTLFAHMLLRLTQTNSSQLWDLHICVREVCCSLQRHTHAQFFLFGFIALFIYVRSWCVCFWLFRGQSMSSLQIHPQKKLVFGLAWLFFRLSLFVLVVYLRDIKYSRIVRNEHTACIRFGQC